MGAQPIQADGADFSILKSYIRQVRGAVAMQGGLSILLSLAAAALVSPAIGAEIASVQGGLVAIFIWRLWIAEHHSDEAVARRRLAWESAVVVGLWTLNLTCVAMRIQSQPALGLTVEAALLIIITLLLGAQQVHLTFWGYLAAIAAPASGMVYMGIIQAAGVDAKLGIANTLFVLTILAISWRQQTSNRNLTQLRIDLMRKNAGLAEAVRLTELAEGAAALGYWRVDPAARSLTWSKQVYAIHGLSPDSFTPSLDTALLLYQEDDRARISACVEEAVARGESYEFQARIVCKDGEVRDVVVHGLCEMNAAGAVTSVFGTLLDVTELKLADASLRQSEARLRLLTENASDTIICSSLDGRMIYTSPAATAVSGFSPEELVGVRAQDFIHPEDLPALTGAFYGLARSGGAVRQRVEMRIRRKAGGWAWVESNAWLGWDQTGRKREFCDIVRDISQRKALDEELVRAAEAAAAAITAKTEFLANMSHEIRTPLTSIIGFSQVLANRVDLLPEVASNVARIASAGRSLLAIVNDILDFSKLEAGKADVEIRPFDPRALIADVADLTQPQLAQGGLTLAIDVAPGLPASLISDQDRLGQVLLNLVSNAIKFSDKGGVVTIRAQYAARGEPPVLRVEVIDNGVGIAADKIDLLFSRFCQADGSISRAYGGTGLGLAICRGIVELLGGQIGVQSVVGEGSVFWFEVPAEEGRIEAEVEDFDAPCEDADLLGKRILVVDDVMMNRELIKAVLAPFGAELVEAASGEEALNLVQTQVFDLVLMDVQMPGMGGLEATRQIRACVPSVAPIVAMTANHLPEQAQACIAAGMSAHVAKPFAMDVLLGAIFYWAQTGAAAEDRAIAPKVA